MPCRDEDSPRRRQAAAPSRRSGGADAVAARGFSGRQLAPHPWRAEPLAAGLPCAAVHTRSHHPACSSHSSTSRRGHHVTCQPCYSTPSYALLYPRRTRHDPTCASSRRCRGNAHRRHRSTRCICSSARKPHAGFRTSTRSSPRGALDEPRRACLRGAPRARCAARPNRCGYRGGGTTRAR